MILTDIKLLLLTMVGRRQSAFLAEHEDHHSVAKCMDATLLSTLILTM